MICVCDKVWRKCFGNVDKKKYTHGQSNNSRMGGGGGGNIRSNRVYTAKLNLFACTNRDNLTINSK